MVDLCVWTCLIRWTVLDTKGSGRVHTNGPSPRQGSTLTPLDESHLLVRPPWLLIMM